MGPGLTSHRRTGPPAIALAVISLVAASMFQNTRNLGARSSARAITRPARPYRPPVGLAPSGEVEKLRTGGTCAVHEPGHAGRAHHGDGDTHAMPGERLGEVAETALGPAEIHVPCDEQEVGFGP